MSNTLNGNLTPRTNLVGSLSSGGGSGGTSNYNDLSNKPSINDVTLSGNKTTSDLGLFSGNYNDLEDIPKINGMNVSGNHAPQYYGCASKLNDLSDVTLSNEILNDSVIVYSNTLNKWVNMRFSYSFMIDKPTINNVLVSGDLTTTDLKFYTEYTATLTAGNTTVTISNAAITGNETIDVYTNVFGVNPTDIVASSGSIVLTFPVQASDVSVKVRLS